MRSTFSMCAAAACRLSPLASEEFRAPVDGRHREDLGRSSQIIYRNARLGESPRLQGAYTGLNPVNKLSSFSGSELKVILFRLQLRKPLLKILLKPPVER